MTAIVTDVHYRMSLALIRDLAQAGVRVICCERRGVSAPLGLRLPVYGPNGASAGDGLAGRPL